MRDEEGKKGSEERDGEGSEMEVAVELRCSEIEWKPDESEIEVKLKLKISYDTVTAANRFKIVTFRISS
jgi:hypothetical protein